MNERTNMYAECYKDALRETPEWMKGESHVFERDESHISEYSERFKKKKTAEDLKRAVNKRNSDDVDFYNPDADPFISVPTMMNTTIKYNEEASDKYLSIISEICIYLNHITNKMLINPMINENQVGLFVGVFYKDILDSMKKSVGQHMVENINRYIINPTNLFIKILFDDCLKTIFSKRSVPKEIFEFNLLCHKLQNGHKSPNLVNEFNLLTDKSFAVSEFLAKYTMTNKPNVFSYVEDSRDDSLYVTHIGTNIKLWLMNDIDTFGDINPMAVDRGIILLCNTMKGLFNRSKIEDITEELKNAADDIIAEEDIKLIEYNQNLFKHAKEMKNKYPVWK